MSSKKFNASVENGASQSETEKESSLDPESYLQSLGFVTENGKLRFKLDEPTTSTAMCQSTTQLKDYSIIDPNDTLSFVVLGKDSMNVIQESSMASYIEIQNKSLSADYNSTISSLTTAEIQKKLSELLQENAMLKETLEQNNVAMKKQFNTLATWQEEVMKVHQSHKQKFEETREMITNLKRENNQLKEKLSEKMERVLSNETELAKAKDKKEMESDRVKELEEKLSILTKELADAKDNCARLTDTIETYQKASNTNELPHSAKESVDLLKSLTLSSTNSDLTEGSNFTVLEQSISESKQNGQSCGECVAKNKEIASLKEKTARMEEKLQGTFAPIQLSVSEATNESSSPERQKFIKNMKEYDEKLRELNECYLSQATRYSNVQEALKECTDLLEIVENVTGSAKTDTTFHDSWSLLQDEVGNYKEKLTNCRSKLADEQVKLISDRQSIIKAQSQFQKILADYNSILYEMEIALEENTKLETLNTNIKRETDHKISEYEKSNDKAQQILEDVKRSLTEERETLLEEKRQLMEEKESLSSQRVSLESQFKSLNDERELLQQERTSLHDEKISLDQQSQLYESLSAEGKKMEQRSLRLLEEINSLNEDVQNKRMEIAGLQRQLAQQTENVELLKTQMVIYEEDFAKEREIKEKLRNEKMEAQMELHGIANRNAELEEMLACYIASETRPSREPNFPQRAAQEANYKHYPCPKCETAFSTLHLLEEHLELCLDSP